MARDARGVLAIVAIYTTFLLFAQFGFLDQLKRDLGSATAVRSVMAWMGVAGLLASALTAAAVTRLGGGALVRLGLLGSAVAAVTSLACHDPGSLRVAAALVGAAIGCATVSIAAGLRTALATSRVGLAAGLGTGLAYGISNLPFLFGAAPWVRATIPAALCLLSATWAPRAEASPSGADTARGFPLWRALPVFLLLVWLDSAAFTYIQQVPALKARSWGDGSTIVQGAVHLAAAIAAGWLLDRGRFFGLLGSTWALFAVAFPLMEHGGRLAGAGGPLYAAGISLYSVALVTYPSAGGADTRAAAWRAAALYGIAGWLGSALGVGMAQDLGRLPHVFVALTGVVIAIAWATPVRAALVVAWIAADGAAFVGRIIAGAAAPVWDSTAVRVARLYGITAALAIAGSLAVVWHASTPLAPDADAVARGRAVYVAEGCIQCHSQYVRPGTIDETWWGPFRALDRDARPPLVGTRRAGPDLLNAGNRRSAVWHALHLRDPRAFTPGSRMPSYDHLFLRGDARGPELVAYLASLGASGGVEGAATVMTSTGRGDSAAGGGADAGHAGSPTRGAARFRDYCAVCHGPTGAGDGRFAAVIADPALDLRAGPLARVALDTKDLARIVRFGIPGTSMPGHESFRDADVADLVAFVQQLRARADASR